MIFVGEGFELRILTRSLDEAAQNQGGVFLVAGEPGVGKTRLLTELGARALDRGMRVLHSHCVPERQLGYSSLWLRIIEDSSNTKDFQRIDPSDVNGTFLALARSNWAKLWSPIADNLESLLPSVTSDSKMSFWIQEWLRATSRTGPVLITLDDLHHADEPTLEGLRCLSSAVQQSSIVVVGTYRPFELKNHSSQRVIEIIQHNSHHLELESLDAGATAELLGRLLMRIPESSEIRRAYELTGGNPLFIKETELIRDESEYDKNPVQAKISGTVERILHERLNTISSLARKLLSTASVFGNDFDPDLIARVQELDSDQKTAGLVELEARGLITPSDGRSYRFTQGLVRQILSEQLSTVEKALLHRRIATAIESQHRHEIEHYAGRVAEHLSKSRDSHALEKIVDYAEIAGAQHSHAGEFIAASRMYSMAIDAMEISNHRDEIRLYDNLMALGVAQKQNGQFGLAQVTFCKVAENMKRLGDRERLAKVSLESPEYHWPLPGHNNQFAGLLAESALDSIGDQQPTLRALLCARLSAELSYSRSDRERSEELAAQAFEVARRLDHSPRILLAILRFRDCTLRHPELVRERLANATEMVRLARQIGSWDTLFDGAMVRIECFFQLGRIDEADTEFEIAQQAVAMSNRPVSQIQILATRVARAISDGRLAHSEQLVSEFRALASAHGLGELADWCWPAMIVLFREQGSLSALQPIVEQSCKTRSVSPVERAMRCWLAIELEQTHEARSLLERIAADNFADLKGANGSLAGVAALVEVCVRLGNVPDYVAILYDYLLPFAGQSVVLGSSCALGATSYYLGKLATSMSRLDDAIAHFESAIEFSQRTGARLWSAYVAADLARALMCQALPRVRNRAFKLLRTAQAEASLLGMGFLFDTCKNLSESMTIDDEGLLEIHNVTSGITSPPIETMQLCGGSAFSDQCSPPKPPGPAFTSDDSYREGEYWTLQYQGHVVRMRHLRGFTFISHLVSRPHVPIHAVDLAALDDDGNLSRESEVLKLTGTDLGPELDARAKQSYRERTQELRRDLEEARTFDDAEKVSKIEQELQFFVRELARSVGIYGRDRKSGSKVERARLSVTNAINVSIKKISKNDEQLGLYLRQHIKTGTFCSYIPKLTVP